MINLKDYCNPPSPDSIMRSLMYAKSTLINLKGRGRQYDPLIDEIIAIESDVKIPAYKYLMTKLKINREQLGEIINELNKDFIYALYDENFIIRFSQEYVLHVRGQRDSAWFKCHLPIVPRIGETIDIPFIGAYIGGGSEFTIKDIRHRLEDKIMRTEVWLGYDDEWEIDQLRDRAIREGKLDSWRSIGMSKCKLAKVLLKLYPDMVTEK